MVVQIVLYSCSYSGYNNSSRVIHCIPANLYVQASIDGQKVYGGCWMGLCGCRWVLVDCGVLLVGYGGLCGGSFGF